MKRRYFLARLTALVGGTLLARGVRAQAPTDSLAGAPDSSAAAPGAAVTGSRPDTAKAAEAAPDSSASENAILLAAAGDTTLGYNLQDHFDQQRAAGVPDEQLWPLYFAGVRSVLDQADIALVNLECPFTERGEKLSKNFNFRARPELVEILRRGSVDVASLANNHTNDWGRLGVKDTIATLKRARIAHFGAGMNLTQARRPAVLERRGFKVAFLGYYFQADPDMLEPEAVYATRNSAGVAGCYKDLACVKAQIEEDVMHSILRAGAVVVYFHWGKEGSYEVRDYQIDLAHRCVDLGCKAVLGAHPHRVQGIELYKGVPIFYSLGNFVYGGIKEPSDTLSMIARVWLPRSDHGSDAMGDGQGSAAIRADLIPVQFQRWLEAPFQPIVLEGAAREEAMSRIAGYSRGFVDPMPQLAPYLGDQQLSPAARPSSSGP